MDTLTQAGNVALNNATALASVNGWLALGLLALCLIPIALFTIVTASSMTREQMYDASSKHW